MRVAAGVLLIIAAIINLGAGLTFLGSGAAVGSMGKLASMAEKSSQEQGRELSEEQKAQLAEANQASKDPEVGKAARVAMAYGLFQLITVGTSIAGAVCLFRRRSPKVIVVAAALLLLAEAIGCVTAGVMFGPKVIVMKLLFSAVGIIAGIFSLVGARQVAAASAEPAMAAPTGAPM
jgi:hypothetical protein